MTGVGLKPGLNHKRICILEKRDVLGVEGDGGNHACTPTHNELNTHTRRTALGPLRADEKRLLV